MNGEKMLDLGEVAVELTAKLDQEPVVGKFERKLDRGAICRGPPGG